MTPDIDDLTDLGDTLMVSSKQRTGRWRGSKGDRKTEKKGHRGKKERLRTKNKS